MTDGRPTHLDLFSGIGGFALAAAWAGFRTIAFCEIDPYCRKVLAKNFLADTAELFGNGSGTDRQQSERQVPEPREQSCPILSNIFDLNGKQFAGVSLITGGFPCQPFSVAGKRRGKADDRAIWPQMFRVISQARPSFVLGENVPGIIPMELDNVLSDLEGIGYATRSFVIPACGVDARHRRDRVWIIARNITDSAEHFLQGSEKSRSNSSDGTKSDDQFSGRLRGGTESRNGWSATWLPEPDVGRVAHGIPSRVDRLKALGNAIVPQVAFQLLVHIRKLLP